MSLALILIIYAVLPYMTGIILIPKSYEGNRSTLIFGVLIPLIYLLISKQISKHTLKHLNIYGINIRELLNNKMTYIIIPLLFFITTISYIFNINNPEIYQGNYFYRYIITLGVKFILGSVGFLIVLNNIKQYPNYEAVLLVLTTSILMMSFITIVNIFLSLPLAISLQVSRSFNFITISNSILAAVTLYTIIEWMKKRKEHTAIINTILIYIFLFSTFSTLFHIEYVYYDNDYRLSDAEYDAIIYLENVIEQNPASLVITTTKYKSTKAVLAAPTFVVNNTHILSSTKPIQQLFLNSNLTELKIPILPYDKLDIMYIFLYKNDFSKMSRDSYLYQFTSETEPVYKNSVLSIYELPFTN
jgi:hypothetical protein